MACSTVNVGASIVLAQPQGCCGRGVLASAAAASPVHYHHHHFPRSGFPTKFNGLSTHREPRSSAFSSCRHYHGKTNLPSAYPEDILTRSHGEKSSCHSLARNSSSSSSGDNESDELSHSHSAGVQANPPSRQQFPQAGCNRRDLVLMGATTAFAAVAGVTASKVFASEESEALAPVVQEETSPSPAAIAPVVQEESSPSPAATGNAAEEFASPPTSTSTLTTPVPKDQPAEKDAQPSGAAAKPSSDKVDTAITDKVYMDITMCPSAARSDRPVGKSSQLCGTGEPLGRIVIGLYGRLVPQTVKNFKAMMTGAAGTSYAGTIFHRVLAGQYIQGGRQGAREGEVSGLLKLKRSQETVAAKSYKLTHTRPGTVSLALAANDDDDETKLDIDYHNVQFLITTGPGPAPQLDNGNIVIGTVMEGLDVVAAIAKIPTYRPNERIRQFNEFATFLGDERAANARNFWDRPLKPVVISGCGELQIGFPVFPPGLP